MRIHTKLQAFGDTVMIGGNHYEIGCFWNYNNVKTIKKLVTKRINFNLVIESNVKIWNVLSFNYSTIIY